jgi:hypothetical protein
MNFGHWTTAYKETIRQLSTPSLYAEILKLENSIKHLHRSDEELREHGKNEEAGSWIVPIIEENEDVIAKQTQQITFIKDEIIERGLSSEHADEDMVETTHGESITNGNGNGTGNSVRHGEEQGDEMEGDEPEDGVHL